VNGTSTRDLNTSATYEAVSRDRATSMISLFQLRPAVSADVYTKKGQVLGLPLSILITLTAYSLVPHSGQKLLLEMFLTPQLLQ